MYLSFFPLLLVIVKSVNSSVTFPWENIQLNHKDTLAFPSIAFGDASHPNLPSNPPPCRAFPGSTDWPLDSEWQQLNSSLGGSLLKPNPPSIVCYPGPLFDQSRCNYLLTNASNDRFWINDPVTAMSQWAEGGTCPNNPLPGQNCTQGGFPVYVVNATTVRDVQIAVNFARNRNIRLVIRNTGHCFLGRSSGAGALSIWTHHLKSFEYYPHYTPGSIDGRAAHVGSGLESWELFQYTNKYNMSIVITGGSTVGAYGGWIGGGGHSLLTSYYGLGSDQPISLQVVTADGRFVTADSTTNEDLFYALRGGGPGTFGVVTSAVVKAYPPVQISETVLAFNGAVSPGTSTSGTPTVDLDTFFAGSDYYHYFGKVIVDNGGTAYSWIFPGANGSYSFTTNIDMPNMSPADVFILLTPMYTKLNELGIKVTQLPARPAASWNAANQGRGDGVGEPHFTSRLMPYANWLNETVFANTMAAIRPGIEAGYAYHGVHMKADHKAAGKFANNAVNPAFRNGIMQSIFFGTGSFRGASAQTVKDAHAKLDAAMETVRQVTSGAGAYINEADVEEPNWQQSFFGTNYERLSLIKKRRDPWGLFWAPSTVGSEAWKVNTEDGLPSQNGMLCRT